MTIEELEEKFSSLSNNCICCGGGLEKEVRGIDHELQKETESFYYYCGLKITTVMEKNKMISVELKEHCKYKQSTLKRIIKSYE